MPQFDSWSSYWSFARHIRREFRYIHTPASQRFLDRVRETAAQRILPVKAGTMLWRARLGSTWEDDGTVTGGQEIPLPPDEMKPRSWEVREGRANPAGIPCLYLSDRRDTALSEVRPWVCASISAAQFEVVSDQKVVNCATVKPFTKIYLREPSGDKKDAAVWGHIDQAFARPITRDDFSAEYAPTQILAELFRSAGYSGIRYRSSVGKGTNVVLFALDAAILRTCCTFSVKELSYEFEQSSNSYVLPENRTTL